VILSVEPIYLIWIAGLLLAFLGALAGVGRWLLAQFQRRIDDRFASLAEDARSWRQTERNLMELRAHVSEHYVRREDYVRNQSVVEAKLDALAAKLEMMQTRGIGSGH